METDSRCSDFFCHIYHSSKFQYFGQRPSLQDHGPSSHTDSTETNDSLLTCFNQYLWMVATVKQQKKKDGCYCSSRAVKNVVCVPGEWNYWSLVTFMGPQQFLDCSWLCNTRGHSGSRRQREALRKQKKSHSCIIIIRKPCLERCLSFFKKKKIHPKVTFSQADCICLTGQVVLNISQFSQRTVELLRTT